MFLDGSLNAGCGGGCEYVVIIMAMVRCVSNVRMQIEINEEVERCSLCDEMTRDLIT